MYPFSSSTGLKIVSDQKIREVLEQQRPSVGQETRGHQRSTTFSSFLARFRHQSRGQQAEYAPCECYPLPSKN